jgi:hypothetical protein
MDIKITSNWAGFCSKVIPTSQELSIDMIIEKSIPRI